MGASSWCRAILTVAMHNFDAVSGATKVLANILGDHYRTMLPSGATKGDGEVALSLVDVVRQQVHQQIGNARDEFAGLREGSYVFRHAWIASGERPKLGHKVRIGQEAHIEEEIRILRHALAETEAHARDKNALFRGLFLKTLRDVGAQLVDVELRGVDDEVGEAADCAEVAALLF